MYRLLPGWKVYLRDVAENQLRRRVKSNDGRTMGLEPEEWNESVVAGGEGDDRGWDGWMASPSQWTWVWISSGSWWWAGRPDVLQSMGSQRVRHDWATELNWGKNRKTRVTGSLRTCKSTGSETPTRLTNWRAQSGVLKSKCPEWWQNGLLSPPLPRSEVVVVV